MKIKIVGFKVGKSRPTANRTLEIPETKYDALQSAWLGNELKKVLEKSDFVSIRRVD